jgi:RNA polymerase sigma factor (sigma-70 family)
MTEQEFTVESFLDRAENAKKLDKADESLHFETYEAGYFADELLSAGGYEDKYSKEDLEFLVSNGRVAKDEIMESNLYLVVEVSKEFEGSELSQLEILHAGTIGLMKGFSQFDYTKGKRFSGTARPLIRKEINTFLNPAAYSNNNEHVIFIPSSTDFQELQDQILQVLPSLTLREAGVISARFGLNGGKPMTLVEIGKVHGVTIETIRKIEGKLLGKLRHPSRSQVLRDYLD